MSDSTAIPTPADVAPRPAQAVSEPAPNEQTQEEAPKGDDTDWKAEARKWEKRARENRAAAEKAEAEGQRSAEERIASLEQEIAASKRDALRSRVQARHGISDEDADLFLTGTDEETLTRQAQRLEARETERKSSNNHAPNEGNTPSSPGDSDRHEFVRRLTGRG